MLDAAGQVEKWLGMIIDVDDRKRTEAENSRLYAEVEQRIASTTAELKDNRDFLRAVLDVSEEMIQIFEAIRNENGEIVDFRWLLNNHTSESRFGEVRGESLLTRNPGVIQEGIFDAFKRVTETGVPEKAERHYAHEQFDGWFYQSIVKLNDGIATTTKDISDWKMAQAEQREQDATAASLLLESEKRFRALATASTEVGYRMSPDWSEMWQLDGGGFLADTSNTDPLWMESYILPEDRPAVLAAIEAAIRGKRMFEFEHRVLRADGSVGWTASRAVPILAANGEVTEWLGSARDVTSSVEAEQKLRESEDRLRRFGEASQDVLWIRDAENLQWTYLTPAFETIYGLDREKALFGHNYRSWLELVVEEDREHASDNIDRARAGEHVTFEYRIRRPVDGAIRWLRNTDFPITNDAGEVTLIGGIGHDITELKLHQERLEASEERLRNATEVAKLGLWDWDVRTGEIYWSDEHFRMEGYEVGEVVPSYETWAAQLHPDDGPGAEAALKRAMDLHEEFAHEFRVVHRDQSVHWLSGRGSFFYDEGGRPIRMVGAMVDTTERREWEERQNVLLAELQHRTRNLMAVVQSMFEKTRRGSSTIEELSATYKNRMKALARVQGLLSRLNDN